jgi:alpha-L-fucosidase
MSTGLSGKGEINRINNFYGDIVMKTIMILLSALAALVSANTAIEPVCREGSAADAAGRDTNAWIEQHNHINTIAKTQRPDLVFLGDSITQSFDSLGRPVWDQYYSPRNAANYGISGDGTQHILWRIDNGNFDGFIPKVIVLMTGTHNMADNTAQEIAEGITAIVKKLQDKTPSTKILLLSTFPSGQFPDHEYRIKTNKLNAIIKNLHDGKNVYYLDITQTFLCPDGSANTDLMSDDFVHLKPAGYKAWALAIENKLTELLDEEYIARAAAVRPHPRQIEFQKLGFTMFIHFGVNTFTDREWGNGKEDPSIFNPTALDTDQWAATAKAAGMKMILLTAKHHDGFCLWPSKYTAHSVKSSPWKNGNGNIIADLSASCKKYGLKLGVYLSPADLYQIESPDGCYGNKSEKRTVTIPTIAPKGVKDYPTFTRELDDYNTYFMNQLYELLTEYGPIYEVWFDGANPKPGTGQTYDYDAWYNLIRTLQPDACIAIAGPDVRWVGNEDGRTRQSEWSVISTSAPGGGSDGPPLDLGSRNVIKNATHLIWYPAETNTSIRPGWFYHASQDNLVKSLDHLLDIYYTSVGGNSVFLLNVPPDKRGLIHENDVARLKDIGDIIGKTFETNLALNAPATASQAPIDGSRTVDGSNDTFWMPSGIAPIVNIDYDLGSPKTFNRVMLCEYIPLGQRIESFEVYALIDGKWKQFASSTTVGFKRLLRFPDVTAQKVRLQITQSRLSPMISEFGLYLTPVLLSTPDIKRDVKGNVTLECAPAGSQIRYTLDGSTPTEDSELYINPIQLPNGGIVKAVAFSAGKISHPAQAVFDIVPAKWKIHYADSENLDSGAAADKAIDGDPDTVWESQGQNATPSRPHEIQIDLGETLTLKGFTYLPRKNSLAGTINDYEFYTSMNGKRWGQPVSKGRFDNICNNPVQQRIYFDAPIKARYIRLVGLTDIENKPFISAAEIGVITR